MNNTASLRRTDGSPLAAPFTRAGLGTALATVMFTVLMTSFRPFQPAGGLDFDNPQAMAGGDIVNQLGFTSLAGLAVFCLASFVDRRVLSAIFSPWWLLLLALFMLSVLNANDPNAALRASIFTLSAILAITAVLSAPRDAEAFSMVIAVSGLFVVGLSYVGLVVFPDAAIHGAGGFEPEHAGLWRGVFSHKNIAGPVMACFSFAGLYLWRRGWTRSGILLFFMAVVFMANTGSKTTLGMVPLAILIVMVPGVVGMRTLTPILFALANIGTALATLGIVFIGPLHDLAQSLAPDLTYTGRTLLWAFSGEMIAQRPWTGYGYESFWGTPFITTMEQSFDTEWDIRGIVHGHNGYMDIAVLMGLPTLAVAVIVFFIEPMRDYMRTPMRRENVYLAEFFMMIVLFTLLNAFLESFFFRRADPVWLFFLFGVFGLRLAARFPVTVPQR